MQQFASVFFDIRPSSLKDMASLFIRPMYPYMAKVHEIGTSRVWKKWTFHTFHHDQCNGCFKHLEYRLSMSKKPCHTIIFSFRVVGPQSWVLRVTKLSCFLRYPHDTSHLLYFFMYKWILITYCSVLYNRRWASLMGNAIINIMLSVLIGRFQHVHICKIQLSDGTLVCR